MSALPPKADMCSALGLWGDHHLFSFPPVQPRYSEVPGYEYRSAPPVVVEEPPSPVVPETYVVRRPVVVAPPPVVVEEYPVYASPSVYAAPPVYAYAGPGWRGGWGHRGHFRGRWQTLEGVR